MEEIQMERRKSFAVLVISILVFVFHFVSKYIESKKTRKGQVRTWMLMREEIKQLLKEARSLSQPSTFAQAAKRRRMAAAKEKELAKYLETREGYEIVGWFIWKALDDIKGRLLSWRAGNSLKDTAVVGVIPWLIVSTRVSKFL